MEKDELIVFVHGFDSEVYNSQEAFNRTREAVLSSDSKLIVLTNKPVISKLRLRDRAHEMYETNEANSIPKIGWDKFSQRIRKYGLPVLFIGAELHFDTKGQPYAGCVLEAYEKTTIDKKRIDPAQCWIGE